MKDSTYIRHFLCCGSIEREQFAIRDRGFHWHGVQHPGKLKSEEYCANPVALRGPSMRCVSRPIGVVDDCGVVDMVAPENQLAAAVRSACVRQRLASSILNRFSLCGFASFNAASAAWRKLASFADLLISAASASGERHGFVPTPPTAIRARAILPPAIVSTTAAELREHPYDARSRSL